MKKIIVGVVVFLMAIVIFPSTSSAFSISDLQAQISALLAQVKQLQVQLAQMQNGASQSWCHTFNNDIGIGNSGNEVTELVNALVRDGIGEKINGNTYDEVIASYVSTFQQKYKSEILTPAGLYSPTGFVGGRTRAKLNTLYGCGATSNPIYSSSNNQIQTTTTNYSIPVPTVYLSANNTSIISDGKPGTITLSWYSTNATECNFIKEIVPTSGSKQVSLSETTSYDITCTGPGGSITSNLVTVSFQLTPQTKTISVDLKINNSDGPLTQPVGYSTFTWTSTNADYCTASGETYTGYGDSYWTGFKPLSGSENVWTGNVKSGKTDYSITCESYNEKVNSGRDNVMVTFQ